MFRKTSFLLIYFFTNILVAQNLSLGTWKSHVPLSNATSIAQSKDYIYGANNFGVVSVNVDNGFTQTYTKATGLTDNKIVQIGYDISTTTLVIAYDNANIDLIQNGKVSNIPFLMTANITGSKNINYIFTFNGIAYIATDFGIVKLDLVNKEIDETYFFKQNNTNWKVNTIYANANTIYAGTQFGLLKASLLSNINLTNFNNWTKINNIPTQNTSAITMYNNNILVAINDTIYQYNGSNWSTFFTDVNWQTMHLNNCNNGLQIAQQKIESGNNTGNRIGNYTNNAFTFYTNTFNIERPAQILADKNNTLWHADFYRGLISQNNGFSSYNPNGPFATTSKEMAFMNNSLWVASSGIGFNWSPAYNFNGFYEYNNTGNWNNRTIYNTPFLDSIYDIATVQAIPEENILLFGAHFSGIFEFNPTNGNVKVNKYEPNTNNRFRPTAMVKDDLGNVFITNIFGNNQLLCRKSGGEYVYFSIPNLFNIFISDIEIDNANHLWITTNNNGIIVYNYNNTIDDKTDDNYITYTTGEGYGNLPVNSIRSIKKDNDGILWIGTSQGISIVNCPECVFNNDGSGDAEQICIDRNDGSDFCDPLLLDEVITVIEIDGANRKWIGTNNGVFLVSADGLKTIHHFTKENSPLLSNEIRFIKVQPQTGDVFISTEKGLCSYRGDATVTVKKETKAYVYPNPVRPDYFGVIAVHGVPNNSTVKFVDEAGNLVFETIANGGTATWDGKDINGKKVASGIYHVLCVGTEKKEKLACKFVIIN